jgi:hypothetical protein
MTQVSDEALQDALANISIEQVLERSLHIETIHRAGTRGLEGLTRLLRFGTEREKAIAIVQIPRIFYRNSQCAYSQMAFDDLLAVYHESSSAQFRRRLLRIIESVLWRTKDKTVLKQIFFAFFDDEPLIRQSAVVFISRHRLSEAVPYLSLLLDDDSLMVRKAARGALQGYKIPEADFAIWEWEKRQKR